MDTVEHKRVRTLALIGTLGGLICSVADYFLELVGPDSQTLGSLGVVESAWENISLWRFPASIWIASLAVPMYTLGVIAVIIQMRRTHPKFGNVFGATFLTGVLGGLFIHIIMCVMPVVYKYVLENGSQELAINTVDVMTGSFLGPFFIYYLLLIIFPLIMWMIYCFKKGSLYRPWMALVIGGGTLLCIIVSSLIPSLEWLGVGAISRMLAAWGFVAWVTEGKIMGSKA